MKIAVTSTGNSLDSEISSVFGRCPYFIIADMENGEIKETSQIINPAKNERGAGNMAAQFMIDQGVEALISGKLGPIAFGILKNAGIKMYKINPGSVKTNLKYFGEGKLEKVTSLSSGFPEIGKRGSGRRDGMEKGR
jgi:predicted Fe-Mo cluster-binding NifX family protein